MTVDRQDKTEFPEDLKGKLRMDKGSTNQTLFGNLFPDGMQLTTKVKSNMKNSPTSVTDR